MTNIKPIFSCVFVVVLASVSPAKAEIETVFPALLGKASLDHSDQVATGYEMLKNIWSTAKTVTEKSVNGWNEGRCYFRDRPNQPVAALLVVSPQESNLHGDLKGLLSRKSIAQFMNRDSSATWFQNLAPATVRTIEKKVAFEKKVSSFAYESSGAEFGLVTDFLETDKREPFRLTLRRLGGHIYTSTTCTTSQFSCYDQSRPGMIKHVVDSGESAQYCYYFRRLRK